MENHEMKLKLGMLLLFSMSTAYSADSGLGLLCAAAAYDAAADAGPPPLIYVGQGPFQCPKCSKVFRWQSGLTRHQGVHTRKKRTYQCIECSKPFQQKFNLDRHMRVHTGERSFKCDECDKTFTQSSNLRAHMRTHTGETPYKCDQDGCERVFADRKNLRNHTLRMHSVKK